MILMREPMTFFSLAGGFITSCARRRCGSDTEDLLVGLDVHVARAALDRFGRTSRANVMTGASSFAAP